MRWRGDHIKADGTKNRRSFFRGGFTMLELMISLGILMMFGGGMILAFTYSTRSAINARNAGLARALVNQQLSMMQSRPWNALTSDPVWTGTPDAQKTVTLWQYTKNGNITSVNAYVDISTSAVAAVSTARKVNVKVTYTFQGKTTTMESFTIRSKDT